MNLRECCKNHLDEDDTISPKTINNIIAYIHSVFTFAIDQEDYEGLNPARKLFVPEVDDIDRSYSQDELKALWDNLKFDPKHPSQYWSVLIVMYQGMRLNETCQIHSEDIYQLSLKTFTQASASKSTGLNLAATSLRYSVAGILAASSIHSE